MTVRTQTDIQLEQRTKWWEKTVEYYFIKKYANEAIIAPLDGNYELAGDALFYNKQRWIIIEFKDKKSSLDTEQKKFKSYAAAKAELGLNDLHHFLIYGMIIDQKFSLIGETYFSRQGSGNIQKILNAGISHDKFMTYLKRLLHYKSEKGKSAGGNIGSYTFVAGISSDNKIVSCMSLHEFGLEHKLDLEAPPKLEHEREIKRDRSYDGPSL